MTKKHGTGHAGRGSEGAGRGDHQGDGDHRGRGKLWVPEGATGPGASGSGEAEAAQPETAGPGPIGGELAEANAKAVEYLELAQRVQADFENYKKRIQRGQAQAVERASERVVRELLPVLDDLDRTLDATASEEAVVAAEHLTDAVRLVRDKLLAVLAREGVEVIDPAGESFDPTVAEAMMQVPRDDLQEHTVVEVCERGYRMGEKLLRAAKVVVSGSAS